MQMATSKAENLTQVLSCELRLVDKLIVLFY
jgi:hypothetical protein